MNFQFDNLEYQRQAVNSVINLLEGQSKEANKNTQNKNTREFTKKDITQLQTYGVSVHSNPELTFSKESLIKNLQKIQKENNLPTTEVLEKYFFNIEMETGTGKTYVYLKTIFELNQRYKFTKFIILVPSIAIREGVIKNLEITAEHFKELYTNQYKYFLYKSSKPNEVISFARESNLNIMVINIQAINTEDRVIKESRDKALGFSLLEYIRAIQPILIIDEPQSVDNTEKARKSIDDLNPLLEFRYSATHRNNQNIIYKLDPIQAYRQNLVKKIEVASVIDKENFNQAYIKLIDTNNDKGIKAKLEIEEQLKEGFRKKQIWCKNGDDLFQKSKAREIYQGYKITDISCEKDNEKVGFSNGKRVDYQNPLQKNKDVIMRTQIAETIRLHLKKEKNLCKKGVKVLSLFFIDRVNNYRLYNEDGSYSLGKIGKWFEEEYKKISEQAEYQPEHSFSKHNFPIERLHNGYFSQDNKKKFKDTQGNTQADKDTYQLIMKDKEKLLSNEEPLRFIFSHSALREGWDNPNIFQICTLNESNSKIKKRQEIGRGLRLAVDNQYKRIKGDMNLLSVVANESYDSFARTLQQELQEDCGESANLTKNAYKKEKIIYKDLELDENFRRLWEKIKQRTTYNVKLDSKNFIKQAKEKIQDLASIESAKISINRTKIEELSVREEFQSSDLSTKNSENSNIRFLPNILAELQKETNLTKQTLKEIIIQSEKLEEFLINPELFILEVKKCLRSVLGKLLIDGIKYQKIDGFYYEMQIIKPEEEEEVHAKYFYEVQNTTKTPLNPIVCDSGVEQNYAKDLDSSEQHPVYLKLPRKFQIPTPVGNYNPDWAFIRQNGDKVYFITETKGGMGESSVSITEDNKIACGKKHCEAIGVAYEKVEKL